MRRRLGGWLQPQVSSAARDRRDVGFVLVAVMVAVVPHFWHLPWWSTALIGVLWFWRAWLTIARRPPPGRIAMVPLLATATALVLLEHHSIIGHEAGVNLLVLLIALKLLELRGRRDLNLVVFLAFFVQVTLFLYDQSLFVAMLATFTTLLLFFVLLSINLVETDLPAARKAQLVLGIFAKSLPLIVALFVLFPRLQSPLLAFGGAEMNASTGLSDSMAPGSIQHLIESHAVALIADFKTPFRDANSFYWRGPVLGDFDGRTWKPLAGHGQSKLDLKNHVNTTPSTALAYQVTMKPTQRKWILGLELAKDITPDTPVSVEMYDDMQWLADRVISRELRYNATSYTEFTVDANLSEDQVSEWARLPAGRNPKTHNLAAELRKRIVKPMDPDAPARDQPPIKAVLEFFRRGDFHYTLDPPKLSGDDPVDQFLFSTRLGFCEHYASAFVVLMRELNIPARVVTGYQGGEPNPLGNNYLTVHQSDAHAWAEVWLPGRGWNRVDPTAEVAPLRIDRAEARLQNENAFGGYGRAGTLLGWIGTLRLDWEALEYAWNQAVLDYTMQRQQSLISRLGVEATWRNVSIVFAVTVTIVLALLGALSLRHREVRDPLAVLVSRMRERLARVGLRSPASEGLTDLRRRLERALRPAQAEEAAALLQALEDARYCRNGATLRPAELRRLRARIRRFRPLVEPG